jgi:hypothetical protein
MLLLEAGSRSTGTILEPKGRGMSAVGSHYQKTGEDSAGWGDLIHAVVNCRLCELVIVLQLLVVMVRKC